MRPAASPSAGRPRWRTALPLAGVLPVLAALLGAPAVPAAAAPGTVGETESFTFAPCNRAYARPEARFAPVHQGPVTLHLASPENALSLEDHQLRLTPLADGSHRARFSARLRGEGRLVADVEMGEAVTRMEDRVTVPRQVVTVEGRVRLARGGAAGAPGPPDPAAAADGRFEITPLELPERVELDIRSDLAERLGLLCDSFALLVSLDCAPLRSALSRAAVPLPDPGETYLLPPECVDGETARRLDAYLERAGQAVAVR